MSLASESVARIKRAIPPEILQEAFLPRRYDPTKRTYVRDNSLGTSVDAVIRDTIIDAWVGADVNLVSGVETTIPLNGLPHEWVDLWNVIYRIPKSVTGGRNITAVYAITLGTQNAIGYSNLGDYGKSSLVDAGAGLLAAAAPLPAVSSAKVELIGNNVILVNDTRALSSYLHLRCQLTHEQDFANIPKAYWPVFFELCCLAAKAHVYNTMIIRLDEGALKSGGSLGRIREKVDEMADAETQYKEYLNDKWKVNSHMADKEKYRRTLSYAVGGRR